MNHLETLRRAALESPLRSYLKRRECRLFAHPTDGLYVVLSAREAVSTWLSLADLEVWAREYLDGILDAARRVRVAVVRAEKLKAHRAKWRVTLARNDRLERFAPLAVRAVAGEVEAVERAVAALGAA